jgi:hypothetical protein
MLKGKSTIELFDGISGKKKDEYIDENLVTNAMANMFDLRNELIVRGVQVQTILERLTPLYPTYLRGILLWDSVLPNNPDVVLPPPGIRCAGHAGGTYSGANPLRGTLNSSETVVNGNSIKMVWDFATDKVDATIRSISLTSILGGNRGWLTPWEAGTFFRARIHNGNQTEAQSIPYAATSVATNISGVTFAYMGELRRGVQYYVADRGDNNLTILEQSYVGADSIGIFDTAGVLTHNAPHSREILHTVASNARFLNLNSNSIIDMNGNLVHVMLSGTGNRTARIRTVNIVTRSIVSDRTIMLSENVNDTSAAFFKGKLYASVTARNSICEFGEDGQFIRSFGTGFTSAGRYYCYGDYLFSTFNHGGANNTGCFSTDGVNHVLTQAGLEIFTSGINMMNSTLKPPLFVMLAEGNSAGLKTVSYVTPYLATINNLHSPVTKNSLNTMKVTYELTQD